MSLATIPVDALRSLLWALPSTLDVIAVARTSKALRKATESGSFWKQYAIRFDDKWLFDITVAHSFVQTLVYPFVLLSTFDLDAFSSIFWCVDLLLASFECLNGQLQSKRQWPGMV